MNSSGTKVAETRYDPWGGERLDTGTQVTDYTFTGQRDTDFGLMYFNARFYDPALGRFVQADTLVPGLGNPMAYDRYKYALSNPLKYIDPSGHCSIALMEREGCTAKELYQKHPKPINSVDQALMRLSNFRFPWDRLPWKLEIELRKRESLWTDETVTCSWGASCWEQMMYRAYHHESRVVLGGKALELLAEDKELENYQTAWVAKIVGDPRYGVENFVGNDPRDEVQITFGQYGGHPLVDGFHSETWMVRAATVDATVFALESGDVFVAYQVYDIFDLRPDWGNPYRNNPTVFGISYNRATTVLGFWWHELLG